MDPADLPAVCRPGGAGRLARATFASSRHPCLYGRIELPVHPEWLGALPLLEAAVVRACAASLRACPPLRARVLFGRLRVRQEVDVTCVVSLPDGANIGVVHLRDADLRPLEAVAEDLRAQANNLRGGQDAAFESEMALLRRVPWFLLRPLLAAWGWWTGALGWGPERLGVQPFPLGSCCVSNVGVFGLDEGWSPPTPFGHNPLDLVIGRARPEPVVRDGRVAMELRVPLAITADARVVRPEDLRQLTAALTAAFA